MKNIRIISLVSLFTLSLFSTCAQEASGDQVITNTNAESFESGIQGDIKAIVLDVRTPEEFEAGHVKGAININFYDDDFAEQVSKVIDVDATVYVYCKAGTRSANSCKIMENKGFKHLINLKGGFDNWVRAGKPVVK
jgi:phage shock protein E